MKYFQCLEDLVIHYDGSVRNAIGEIVEFIYGGDGLDPVFMEVKDRPVDFHRQLMHNRAQNAFRDQRPLTGDSIVPTAERILANEEFSDARADFRKECLTFLKSVGEGIADTQRKFGRSAVAVEINRTTEGHVRTFLQAVSALADVSPKKKDYFSFIFNEIDS